MYEQKRAIAPNPSMQPTRLVAAFHDGDLVGQLEVQRSTSVIPVWRLMPK
jgi:hypothetical protein